MTTVTAHAYRSGDWWAVEVPEVPGLFTQAKRLEQVPAMVKDAAGLLGAGDVEVTVVPHLPDAVQAKLDQAKAQAAEAVRVQQESSRTSREVAAELRKSGLSVRDSAAILGVSAQRISQLVPGRYGH
jgi:predicted RNase H-like HicB family nuclease